MRKKKKKEKDPKNLKGQGLELKNKEERLVRVWNLLMKSGKILKAATIEQGERKPSMCEGCSAPCCRGMFRPVLTSEEFESRKFPIAFNPVPLPIKIQVPQVEKLIVLNVDPEKGCPFFDTKTNKCKLWPNPPKACLFYDCREDLRPEIRKFAKQRKKEWKKERKKKLKEKAIKAKLAKIREDPHGDC